MYKISWVVKIDIRANSMILGSTYPMDIIRY